jgi:hypothetical protein
VPEGVCRHKVGRQGATKAAGCKGDGVMAIITIYVLFRSKTTASGRATLRGSADPA